MRRAGRMICTIAAASMAFAPIAAQANTRASDNNTVYNNRYSSNQRLGRTNFDPEGGLYGVPGIVAAMLFAIGAGAIIILIEDDNNQSPGGN